MGANDQKGYASRCDLLIAEDEENIRLILGEIIGSAIPDLRVEFATDGWEAMLKVEALRPRIVWTCIRMPHMNGLELVEAIRGDPGLRETKIIVCTAHGSKEVRNSAIESGVDVFMSKGDLCHSEKFELHIVSAIARCLLCLAVPSSYLELKGAILYS